MSVEYVNPEGAVPAQGLYSHAGTSDANKLIFVAGQLAVGKDGGVVGVGDFEAQFHCVFDNLVDVLDAMGRSVQDIVKFTTYLTDRANLASFMSLRARRFPEMFVDDTFPPNTLLLIQGLVKPEFLIEVEAVVAG